MKRFHKIPNQNIAISPINQLVSLGAENQQRIKKIDRPAKWHRRKKTEKGRRSNKTTNFAPEVCEKKNCPHARASLPILSHHDDQRKKKRKPITQQFWLRDGKSFMELRLERGRSILFGLPPGHRETTSLWTKGDNKIREQSHTSLLKSQYCSALCYDRARPSARPRRPSRSLKIKKFQNFTNHTLRNSEKHTKQQNHRRNWAIKIKI